MIRTNPGLVESGTITPPLLVTFGESGDFVPFNAHLFTSFWLPRFCVCMNVAYSFHQ